MHSQLIVVDFTREHKDIPFADLTGFPQNTISYYCDALFDKFSAYLFNYERWGERPLLQLVFWFADVASIDDELKALVKELDKKYQGLLDADLTVVEHRDNLTLCGYTPQDRYPDIGYSLSWLVEPTKEKTSAKTDTETEGQEE